MRGVPPVALPGAAALKLTDLTLARDAAMDAMRGAAARASSLPQSAEHLRAGLAAQRDSQAERYRVLSMLVSRLNQFHMELRLPPGTTVEPAPPADPIRLKGHINETVVSCLQQYRRDIVRTQAEIAKVRAAPLKRESQEAAVAEYVAGLVGKAAAAPRTAMGVRTALA
jgi:hypothetical protein